MHKLTCLYPSTLTSRSIRILLAPNIIWELPLHQPSSTNRNVETLMFSRWTPPPQHLSRWIIHAKTASNKCIQQGYRNHKFTMPHLLSLSKLELIELPTRSKVVESPKNLKANAKKKANAAISAQTIGAVPKAKAPIAALTKKTKKRVRFYSTPTHWSPRKAKASLLMDTRHEENSFHSVLTNPFQKQHTSWPSRFLPILSSIEAAGAPSPNVTTVTNVTNIASERYPTPTADIAVEGGAPSPNVTNVAGQGAPMTTAKVAVDAGAVSPNVTNAAGQGAPPPPATKAYAAVDVTLALTEKQTTNIWCISCVSQSSPSPPSPPYHKVCLGDIISDHPAPDATLPFETI
jgi:hypothetical protein